MIYPDMNTMFNIIEKTFPCNKTVVELCSTVKTCPDPNHNHKMLRIAKTVAGVAEPDNDLNLILKSYGWTYEDVLANSDFLLNYARVQYTSVIENTMKKLNIAILDGKISLDIITSMLDNVQ